MRATHRRTYLVGARMALRGEQGSYDGESLGGNRYTPLMTPRDEVAESLS